jgi:prefoldin subunit 5
LTNSFIDSGEIVAGLWRVFHRSDDMPSDDAIDDALSQIEKLIGKKCDLGKLRANLKSVNSAVDEFNKSAKKFMANRDGLSKDLVSVQNANSKIVNSVKLFGNLADKETFGLDVKSADDKKKVDQAQKILQKAISEYEDESEDQNKTLDELEKHLTHIANYKP